MADSTFRDTCCGLILAGGRARRLGGVEKGLEPWQGHPLVAFVREALESNCTTIIVSANRRLDDYRQWADAVVRDDERFEDAGPLAGLLAGMRQARTLGLQGMLVMPCDTPGVTAAVMEQVATAAAVDADRIVLARVEHRAHPLHGYYPVKLADDLESYLEGGERKVMGFAERHEPLFLDLPVSADIFRNLNSPEDWSSTGL
ncbi:molybdenum cofactor guanylyltransferase MobA [Marinobacter nanhaiticus D15-8W]|uniref:Molybdenum cofactor guanylyltransferase n=1 Tax=Marinobacter nanhaiticus D15-8W TaxID=626887 RepID=N6X0Z1_9GAMM|nr:molybdenum cofactor guanylyltransferase MobA [Marinobacter nanhaiticus]ENO14708.1 molybdenum cofactor guanylyltransferase [Marinobacter nanhaiticus D15-8W]BES69604.1 molybdenum cofactor guanylyltransferase MobA [Marinobacter nanhaiticus D15-8W]